MTEKYLKPKQALNPAFRKVKPNRSAIESFKANLIQLIDRINESESEEFHKNLISDFLKKTYYDPSHFINTKGRNDLVIHTGDSATSCVKDFIDLENKYTKSNTSNIDAESDQLMNGKCELTKEELEVSVKIFDLNYNLSKVPNSRGLNIAKASE